MTYFVYILLCEDGSFYTGVTNDLKKRFAKHLAGLGGAYTRSHPPIKIMHQEIVATRSLALMREAEIKKLTKSQKQRLFQIFTNA